MRGISETLTSTTAHSTPTTFHGVPAHVLSVRSPRLQYKARGTKGTFVKYGLDAQEAQLGALSEPEPNGIYAAEPEDIWGTVDNLTADGSIAKSRWPSTETCGYVNLLRNFAAVIRDGAKQDVKWEEVIEITELAHQSSRERRTLEVPRLMILVLGGGNYVAG